jgi:hypothetical protein
MDNQKINVNYELIFMREYLGMYDIPFVEFIAIKIMAKDKEKAYHRFVEYLKEKGEQTISEDYITLIPLFKLETIE